MKNRIVALLLSLLVMLSLASGVAAAEDRPTLTVLVGYDTYTEDFETNAFTKWVEDSMNVNLDFVVLPEVQGGDKLSVMIMSGDKLPDIINYELDVATTYRYAQQGAFIPLNEYYAREGTNISKALEIAPNILNEITCPDGNIYSVPMYIKEIHDEHRHKIWINQNWLDALGLDRPTTTQEFYDVLKAFKEKDPNGNGIADEIPFVGSTSTQGTATITLMNSFIMEDNADHLIVTDGVLDVNYNKDAYRDGLLYIRSLIRDGLYDTVSFTQTDNDLRAMLSNEEICIVGAFSSSSITRIPVATCPWAKYYYGLNVLEGPDGVALSCFEPKVAKNYWFVTADCKNPELAFQIGDFMFDPTEEAFLRCRYGIPGVNWVEPKEGDKATYSDYGYAPMFVQVENIWSVMQNSHWRKKAPLFAVNGPQGGVEDPVANWNGVRVAEVVANHVQHDPAPGTMAGLLIFTDEEFEAVNDIRATLKSYVSESLAGFVTDTMSIENDWDAYVAELETIGLSKALTIFQQAYDRTNK